MGIVATIPESAVDYVLYGDKSHIVGEYLRNQLSNIPPGRSTTSLTVSTRLFSSLTTM